MTDDALGTAPAPGTAGPPARGWLRVEGAAIGAAALILYLWLGGPMWLLAVMILAPDLSMLGYLAGPRVGAACYNLVHTYAAPAGLALAAVFLVPLPLGPFAALAWVAHIGVDRALGYGLKGAAGFKHTHLGPLR
ncbi:MAG: DUF4260 domain-containing protein [Hasllibacter sp.]